MGDEPFPVDLENEIKALAIVLGSSNRSCQDLFFAQARPEWFTDRKLRQLFRTMAEVYWDKGHASRADTMLALRRAGIDKPSDLLDMVAEGYLSEDELPAVLDILADRAQVRRLMAAVQALREKILADDLSASELRQLAADLLTRAIQQDGSVEIHSLDDVLAECLATFYQRLDNNTEVGIPCGFANLNHTLKGFRRKHLYVLGARPSMGKSTLALNFARNVAARGHGVYIVSLEMDRQSLVDRLIVAEAGITADEYECLPASEQERTMLRNRVNETLARLNHLPIRITDARGISVEQVCALCRAAKRLVPDLALVVVDYLTLLPLPRGSKRHTAMLIGDQVRILREVAGELDVAMLLVCQLNRGVESRDNKRPLLSDLRESGNIEEFADTVMFLYREEYYDRKAAEEKGLLGIAEVHIAKGRVGGTGYHYLRYRPECMRFDGLTFEEEERIVAQLRQPSGRTREAHRFAS